MIEYEEDWIFSLLLRCEGSVAKRAVLYGFPPALFSLYLVLAESLQEVPGGMRETLAAPDGLANSVAWAALSATLVYLLSMRTSAAMSRFWEGTGLLHQMRGEWFDSVNCCVTFSRAAKLEKPQQVMDFRHTLVRLMSLCHGSALEEIALSDEENLEVIDVFGLDNNTLQHLKDCKTVHQFNRVEVLLHLIQSVITKALDDGVLKVAPPILSRVYQTLSRGFVNLLNAKKIADTRFPFPYAQLIISLLMLFTLVTPVIMASLLNHVFWAPFFTFVPVFGFFSMNFVAAELENPFGDDPNDLPMEHFQIEMNRCLLMLLQENADIVPGVSSSRCIRNFDMLKQSLSPPTRLSTWNRARSSMFSSSSTASTAPQTPKGRQSKFGRISDFNAAQMPEMGVDRLTTMASTKTKLSMEALMEEPGYSAEDMAANNSGWHPLSRGNSALSAVSVVSSVIPTSTCNSSMTRSGMPLSREQLIATVHASGSRGLGRSIRVPPDKESNGELLPPSVDQRRLESASSEVARSHQSGVPPDLEASDDLRWAPGVEVVIVHAPGVSSGSSGSSGSRVEALPGPGFSTSPLQLERVQPPLREHSREQTPSEAASTSATAATGPSAPGPLIQDMRIDQPRAVPLTPRFDDDVDGRQLNFL